MLALTLEEKKMPFLGASFMTFFNQLMEAVSQVLPQTEYAPVLAVPMVCCSPDSSPPCTDLPLYCQSL